MKTSVIIAIVLISALVGGGGGLLFYYKTHVIAHQSVEFSFAQEAPIAIAPTNTANTWLDNSKNFNKAYSYPAQEFEIVVDFVDPSIKHIPQKLFIHAVDNYLFFCLNEIFKQKNIDFAYSKNNSFLDLVVYIPKDYTRAQQLIKELQYYEVPYTYQ